MERIRFQSREFSAGRLTGGAHFRQLYSQPIRAIGPLGGSRQFRYGPTKLFVEIPRFRISRRKPPAQFRNRPPGEKPAERNPGDEANYKRNYR